MKHTQKWFSLIEILIGILIVSFIIVAGFQSLSAVGIAKVKIIEKTDIEKTAYYASERFFDLIKRWGTIDYEEYWNRFSYNTNYVNGHFELNTWFGNFGYNWETESNNYGWDTYYCASDNGVSMWTQWCLQDYNIPENDYAASPQRFWQYALQFIDYNSDADESADEDNDGSILWDADDLYLGIWPEAFPNTNDVWELYLINVSGDERTYFRWVVKQDPYAPSWEICDFWNPKEPSGQWCLGTIEFIKLQGKDYWIDHDPLTLWSPSNNDGIIDTWVIHPDFTWDESVPVAGSNTQNYWQPVFPDTVHVSQADFYLFPNKHPESSWRDASQAIRVSPYLQIQLTLAPSWKKKKKIRWEAPVVDIATTIQLLDIDIR